MSTSLIEECKRLPYLTELIKQNGHNLRRYDEATSGKRYTSVFDYSTRYGGTLDAHKYYNDYYVEEGAIKQHKEQGGNYGS